MEKKNKRKSSVLLILLLLVAVVGVVSYTYARYVASASTSSELKAAAFAVSVNGTSIVDSKTTEITVDGEVSTSSNVVEGVIAPGQSVTFTIEIDPTGSETALTYTLSNISFSGISTATVTYSVNGGAATTVSGDITEDIALESTSSAMTSASKQTIVITATWPDDGDGETDTPLAGADVTLTTDITVEQDI